MKNRQARITEFAHGIEIVIPPRRNKFVSGFLVLWLIAWISGEVVILDKLINRQQGVADAFIVFWICAWTFGGLLAVLLQLWNLKGREVIKIDDLELVRQRDYVIFARSRHYELRHIRNMRLTEVDLSIPEMNRGAEFWGLSGGAISFDYHVYIEKMALGVEEVEAKRIIAAIKKRFPDV